ncbi:hypothetical protein VTL71DRAFT_1817, partial [Oculimacula yallundae]
MKRRKTTKLPRTETVPQVIQVWTSFLLPCVTRPYLKLLQKYLNHLKGEPAAAVEYRKPPRRPGHPERISTPPLPNAVEQTLGLPPGLSL